jgi:hypothetical protein
MHRHIQVTVLIIVKVDNGFQVLILGGAGVVMEGDHFMPIEPEPFSQLLNYFAGLINLINVATSPSDVLSMSRTDCKTHVISPTFVPEDSSERHCKFQLLQLAYYWTL